MPVKEHYFGKNGLERFCLSGALQLKDLKKPAGQIAWGQFGAQRGPGSQNALQASVFSKYKEELLGGFGKETMISRSHFSKSLTDGIRRMARANRAFSQRLTGRQVAKPETLEMRNAIGFPFLEQRPQVKLRPKEKSHYLDWNPG